MFDKLRALFTSDNDNKSDNKRKRSLNHEHDGRILQIEEKLNISIHQPSYFLKALRHRSKLVDDNLQDTDSYEQLEFLGDAVLDLAISELLFDKYPNENEGFMTKARSRLVKGATLAKISKTLGLDELIEIGDRAREQGISSSKSVLADIFEALIGAIYRDSGFEEAKNFVLYVYNNYINIHEVAHKLDNYKSALLEYTQSIKLGSPVYRVIEESGPPHERVFSVVVEVDGNVMGQGQGTNKKRAEQKAAFEALNAYNIL